MCHTLRDARSSFDQCPSQPWFHIISKETKNKSVPQIQDMISKELGIFQPIINEYREDQLWNNLEGLEIDCKDFSSSVENNNYHTLDLDPKETLPKRRKRSRLSYDEKIEVVKMLRSGWYTKFEICWRWNISMSTINRILRDFDESRPSPFSEKKVLFWKFEESKLLQKLIDNYLISQDKPFTSKSIQSMLRQELKVLIPLHIIRKMLKENNRQSWKRIPSRVSKWSFEILKYQKFLFWVKFSKWLSHLKWILNVDESTFSRNTKVLYSWGIKGVKHPLKNIEFSGSLSIISAISTAGKTYNLIKEGTIKAHDFIEYMKQLVNTIKESWDIKNEEIGLILDNCSVHSAKEALKYMKEAKLNIYFIPPYWPELAPVEKYFSILKQRVLKKTLDLINLNSKQGKDLIKYWTQEMTESDIKPLWTYYFDQVSWILQGGY